MTRPFPASSGRHQEITIDVHRDEWLSANDRHHWAEAKKRTRALRAKARGLARKDAILPIYPCLIVAHVQYSTRRKADPANAAPTVKALVDGLTDAGVWPDDDSTHVVGPLFKRELGTCQHGWYRIRLELIPQEVPF